MWNKDSDNNARAKPEAPPPGPDALRAQTKAPAPEPGPQRQRAMDVIGPSTKIKGDITSDAELLIEGSVEGSLTVQQAITVGVNGKVLANIKARDLTVLGSVRGNVELAGKLAVRQKGSLIGDVRTVGISIDDGAYFKGGIDIIRPAPAQEKEPKGGAN